MALSKSRIDGDLHVTGDLTAGGVNLPAASVGNAAVQAAAGIEATKLQQQYALNYSQPDGSDVVAAVVPIHIVNGVSGVLVGIDAVCVDAPSGAGDEEITVDLQKGNAAGAYATMLTAPISITDSQADREVVAGTPSVTVLAAGDSLQLVIDQTGSTGTKGQGLIVTVIIREDAV